MCTYSRIVILYTEAQISPTDFLTQLATNSSQKGVSWVIYSGNDDMLVAHFGSQGMGRHVYFAVWLDVSSQWLSKILLSVGSKALLNRLRLRGLAMMVKWQGLSTRSVILPSLFSKGRVIWFPNISPKM